MADILACKTCGQAHVAEAPPTGSIALCVRCGSLMQRKTRNSLHRTAAFSLAALFLYLPANMFPILHMEKVGLNADNTIWSGTVALFREGEWTVAVIVFLASIVIPLLKLLGLFVLVITAASHSRRARLQRTWLYNVVEAIGRWSMLDVFLLAILVSLVKLQRLATVLPGPGLWAFTAVVVLTILASASFDPELLWSREQEREIS